MVMKLETAKAWDFVVSPGAFQAGLEYGYPVCCILFFQYPHSILRYLVPEYYTFLNERKLNIHHKAGRVMCPECLIKYVKSRKK